MATAQFTLHGMEDRLLIARCIYQSGYLKDYLDNHKVLFKGSGTVSLLTGLLFGEPLRICGRITGNGMKGGKLKSEAAHWLLCGKGTVENIDADVTERIKELGTGDLYVGGANAIDSFGNAAYLIGSPGGGGYGRIMGYLYTEGIRCITLAGSQKLIPGNINELYAKVNRRSCDFSYGMSCSLIPIPGEILTEVQAIRLYADVEALIFAAGGYTGAESSVAIQISGSTAEVEKVLGLVQTVKAQIPEHQGDPVSEVECSYPCESCGHHLGCFYSKKNKILKAK